eukprot:GHVT01093627.1.p1 GENE.GHVT01093627.1~~GHVT01093627.1.p1  ORF type:complete len:120 (-),score=9.54 GHVT01093627.1:1202-1561(-)
MKGTVAVALTGLHATAVIVASLYEWPFGTDAAWVICAFSSAVTLVGFFSAPSPPPPLRMPSTCFAGNRLVTSNRPASPPTEVAAVPLGETFGAEWISTRAAAFVSAECVWLRAKLPPAS